MNEIFIYSYIGNFLAEFFGNQMNDIKGKDVTVRMNCPGGDPYAGWSMISKIMEHTAQKILKIDGHAGSMAPIFIPFFDKVIALSVTDFIIHRADAYVSNEKEVNWLANINKNLLNALKKKVDQAKFKEITGHTLEDVFNAEEQFEVYLTGEQALEVGLIDELIDVLDAENAGEVEAVQKKVAAFHNNFINLQPKGIKRVYATSPTSQHSKPKTMNENEITLESLKAENPKVYNAILKQGADKEKDRVQAWLEFSDVSPEEVKKGIEGGEELSKSAMAKFVKMMATGKTASAVVADNDDDNADDLDTDSPEGAAQPGNEKSKTEEGKEKKANASTSNKAVAEFEKEIDADYKAQN